MRFFGGILLTCTMAFSQAAAASLPPPSIPFEYSEGLLWVKVTVSQSSRPLNFLLDTGAEVSTLNSETTTALNLNGGWAIDVQGVQSVTTGRWPVKLTAKAGQVKLPSKYLSLDLSRLSHSCKRPLNGLLGADFIQGKTVEIDFQNHRLNFIDKYSVATSDIILPIKYNNRCACVPISIANQSSQWLRLDTGCATALQWVTPDANYSPKTQKVAIGLTDMNIPQIQTTISMNGHQFSQIPTGLHEHAIFPGESGLLGNDFLARFRSVTIDTKSDHVVLKPL